jgi:hypothetical protein
MGLTDRAKELTETALLKAAELSEVASKKAPDYLDRAADLAVKATDAAAGGVDRATGGRYHDKLEDVAAKVGQSLDRPRTTPEAPTVVVEPEEAPPASGGVTGQAGGPITPASTNPEATDPRGPHTP